MSLLRVNNVSKSFAVEGGLLRRRLGAVGALKNVSFVVKEGETLALVGESGSGKTTLGKIIARLIRQDQGEILWQNQATQTIPGREWARAVQMIFQDPSASLNPKLTVRTLLGEALRVRVPAGNLSKGIKELLKIVGMPTDCEYQYPHQFSGGQKQRLAIARALAVRPRLLVADEPVSALDLSIQAQILNLLLDLKERFKLTVILISHDLAVVGHMADRLLVLKEGEVVEAGDTRQVLSHPAHPTTQNFLDAVPVFLQ